MLAQADEHQNVLIHALPSYTIVDLLEPLTVRAVFFSGWCSLWYRRCCNFSKSLLSNLYAGQRAFEALTCATCFLPSYAIHFQLKAAHVGNKHNPSTAAEKETCREHNRHNDLRAPCTTQCSLEVIKQTKLDFSMVHKGYQENDRLILCFLAEDFK